MPTKPMNQVDRIMRSVAIDGNGCWNWLLGKDRSGYGRMKVQLGSRDRFRATSAHRYAYELFIGAIPHGACVLHRCDNRACCNPAHLFVGTQQDNIRDMHAKGRGPKGYKRNPEIARANARKRHANA
jgi:hypothetical protein